MAPIICFGCNAEIPSGQPVETIWTVHDTGDKWAGEYCARCAKKKRTKVAR